MLLFSVRHFYENLIRGVQIIYYRESLLQVNVHWLEMIIPANSIK